MGTRGERNGRLDAVLAASAAVGRPSVNPAGLVHTTLCHRSRPELVAALVPFLDEALELNDPVFVSLPAPSVAALKTALGHDADRVRWSDSTLWKPHPVRRLRAIRELVEGSERHSCGRLRLVGECPLPILVPAMVTEWERCDAVLNEALEGHPVTVVCSYDESVLPADVVARAPCSHPFIGVGPPQPSPTYLAPGLFLARFRAPVPEAPGDAPSLSGRVSPEQARALVRRTLRCAGGGPGPVPAGVVEDVATTVTELVTNSWQAGAGSVSVRCWRTSGEVGAQVDDDGPGLTDPLAGYRRPPAEMERGRGLWLSRQLVDLLDVSGTPAGTSVRVRAFDAAWAAEAA